MNKPVTMVTPLLPPVTKPSDLQTPETATSTDVLVPQLITAVHPAATRETPEPPWCSYKPYFSGGHRIASCSVFPHHSLFIPLSRVTQSKFEANRSRGSRVMIGQRNRQTNRDYIFTYIRCRYFFAFSEIVKNQVANNTVMIYLWSLQMDLK